METHSHYNSFRHNEFIPKRYSPLAVIFPDVEVEKFMNLCGVSFTDLFSGVASQMPQKMRFVNIFNDPTPKNEAFFDKVKSETMIFSQSFIYPEFEQFNQTNPELTPVPGEMPEKFNYPSPRSSNPPWYTRMLQNLINFTQFEDFEFCDMPSCIIYVTTPDSNKIDPQNISSMLPLPTWMLEFLPDVPIVNIFLYDALVHSSVPNQFSSKGFAAAIPMGLRSRQTEAQQKNNKQLFETIFKYDIGILESKNLKTFIGTHDIELVKAAINRIYNEIIMMHINKEIIKYSEIIVKQKKVSNVVKGWFKKKDSEKTTNVLAIPYSRINRLICGSLMMMAGKYADAAKHFASFVKHTSEPQLARIKINALQSQAMCLKMASWADEKTKNAFKTLIIHSYEANSQLFILKTGLLAAEFDAATNRPEEAVTKILDTVHDVQRLWKSPTPIKALIRGLCFERVGGLMSEERHCLLMVAMAADCYNTAMQYGHALRCSIWLHRFVPARQWPMLAQSALLQKAAALNRLRQGKRALKDCVELLESEKLCKELHEMVVAEFFGPFNDAKLRPEVAGAVIKSLVEVEKVTRIDPSFPVFWGLKPEDFTELARGYLVYARDIISRSNSSTLTFDSWMMDEVKKKEEPHKIAVGQEVTIRLVIRNRYTFQILLSSANLDADFTPDTNGSSLSSDSEDDDQNDDQNDDHDELFDKDAIKGKNGNIYNISEITDTQLCGRDNGTTVLDFKFTPLRSGRFTFNRLFKNYWGFVESDITYGPIVFDAKKSFPRLSLSIVGLPETAFQGFCTRFTVIVRNNGSKTANDISLAFDMPQAIAYDGEIIHKDGFAVLPLPPIAAGASFEIPLIFRAARMKLNKLRFLAAKAANILCFATAEVDVRAAASIAASLIRSPRESGGRMIKVKFTSYVEGAKVKGILTKSGHLLRNLDGDTSTKPIGNRQYASLLAFSADAEGEIDEKWRLFMMEEAAYALLYELPGAELLAQQNLRVEIDEEPRFLLTVENDGEQQVGSKIICHFKRIAPARDGTASILTADSDVLYVRPKSIELAVGEEGASRFCPAIWVGKSQKILSKENNFETDFELMVMKAGIYSIPGFIISKVPNFATLEEIPVTHNFHVIGKR